MDTNQAMEYLNKMHAEADPQPAETAPSEGPAATGEQPAETSAPAPETEVETARETVETDVPETAVENKPQPRKKPTKQESINHAFVREKRRHKAEMEAKDKRIAELEETIKKYSVLEQTDFDPNDVKSYIDHSIALNGEKTELERLKTERDRMATEEREREASERHYRQVNDCFGSDDEREHYWNLLRNGGQKFREFLNEYDPDGTIDQFVGDSDIAPLLISTLMRNPETLKSIVEKRNPMRKMIALQQLETRISLNRKVARAKADKGAQQNPQPKPKLPILGSQVSNPGASSESTKRDWNRFLAEHPRGH